VRPEEVLERLRPILVDESIVWLSVEEAKVWGMNIIYYTLSVEPAFRWGVAAFEIVLSTEEMTPIATMLSLDRETAERIELEKARRVLTKFNAFVYSYGDYTGLLIPIEEPDLARSIAEPVREIARELLGQEIDPRIDGWTLDLATIG